LKTTLLLPKDLPLFLYGFGLGAVVWVLSLGFGVGYFDFFHVCGGVSSRAAN